MGQFLLRHVAFCLSIELGADALKDQQGPASMSEKSSNREKPWLTLDYLETTLR